MVLPARVVGTVTISERRGDQVHLPNTNNNDVRDHLLMLSKLWLFAPVWLLDYYFQTNRNTALLEMQFNQKRTVFVSLGKEYLHFLRWLLISCYFTTIVHTYRLTSTNILKLRCSWFRTWNKHVFFACKSFWIFNCWIIFLRNFSRNWECWDPVFVPMQYLTCSACMYFPTSIKIPKYLQPLYSSHENIEWRHFV